jgi:hypothetical protein
VKVLPLLGAALLAFTPGCSPKEARPPIYAAWEEGLTLGYEAQDLSAQKREASRSQKQVTRTVFEGDLRKVEVTYTTLQSHLVLQQVLRKGGVFFVDGQGKEQLLLPEGFPDGPASWETPSHRFTLLGRARWEHDSPPFPETQTREGVWVEAVPLRPGGTRMRAFYLPDIGEAESREWRDGRWVTTNLLVSRGFTEIPRVRNAK